MVWTAPLPRPSPALAPLAPPSRPALEGSVHYLHCLTKNNGPSYFSSKQKMGFNFSLSPSPSSLPPSRSRHILPSFCLSNPRRVLTFTPFFRTFVLLVYCCISCFCVCPVCVGLVRNECVCMYSYPSAAAEALQRTRTRTHWRTLRCLSVGGLGLGGEGQSRFLRDIFLSFAADHIDLKKCQYSGVCLAITVKSIDNKLHYLLR